MQPASSHNNYLTQVLRIDALFSVSECRGLIDRATNMTARRATLDTSAVSSLKVRDSQVCFLEAEAENEWLYVRLESAIARLNQLFQLRLEGFGERLQVARYGIGGHYDWHIDIGTGLLSQRKLSLSVQLSADTDYEGGDLEFLVPTAGGQRLQGTLIAFPSFAPHRVTPVTRGERWSLVSWISGPPFT